MVSFLIAALASAVACAEGAAVRAVIGLALAPAAVAVSSPIAGIRAAMA
jgi:hypothetical protein